MKTSRIVYFSPFILACAVGILLGIKSNKEITDKTIQKMTDGFLAIRAGDGIVQSNDIKILINKNENINCYFEKISKTPLRDLNTCLQNPLCVQIFNTNHPITINDISNAFQKIGFCNNKQIGK